MKDNLNAEHGKSRFISIRIIMKAITTNGIIFEIDDNMEYLLKYKWSAQIRTDRGNQISYIRRGERKNGKYTTIYLHKEICPCEDGMVVDHIDGDPTNNKIENLRICTPSENSMNKKKKAPCSSKYKGVTKFRNGFMASIMKNYKKIYLGFFKSEEDAYAAYCEASKIYHGIYGRT